MCAVTASTGAVGNSAGYEVFPLSVGAGEDYVLLSLDLVVLHHGDDHHFYKLPRCSKFNLLGTGSAVPKSRSPQEGL